jgi:hypothetical protein
MAKNGLHVFTCEEGLQLKQQYELALLGWDRSASLWQKDSVVAVSGSNALQLRAQALAERNAAADRMYLHRARCAFCRKQR